MRNQSNLTKYRILAPIYDRLMSRSIFRSARHRALSLLDIEPGDHVLLVGVGTGEDLAFVPPATSLVGIDLSEEMLEVAQSKFPSKPWLKPCACSNRMAASSSSTSSFLRDKP